VDELKLGSRIVSLVESEVIKTLFGANAFMVEEYEDNPSHAFVSYLDDESQEYAIIVEGGYKWFLNVYINALKEVKSAVEREITSTEEKLKKMEAEEK
jgi:hypothetical protein